VSPPTLLIVDDHPSFRASARIVLESEGFTVVGEAADGAAAIEACCRLRPEVVLLDIQLPDMNGFMVCDQLLERANGTGPPKIILTSSRDSADYGSLVVRSGARGFVPKAELSGARMQELL
jgi:DNA-binding NarL/FixJ family response regulator